MTSSTCVLPLRGNGSGEFRVSTLARELAAVLGLPAIHLDTLFWDPGWQMCPVDEFRARVRAALDRSGPRGWIVDGNYTSRLGNMVGDAATDVIWLDPPLLLYFPRLCWRTLLRLLRIGDPCAPGCDESIREVFFSSESIIWWCLSNHWTVRKREGERYRTDGVHVGGNCRRIAGWGGELAAWKRDVRAMVEAGARRSAARPS
ncbi:uncharacterized protein BXZ73DRAFT_88638 [Epithele typhae]|uniref:uncharacterized protein n=1 Tax=Epithele typhae TaxID=378194 RepID=UPI002007FCCF|nr:uncharacterized protein BXZ73DRAFT_88638 [Epithele typhae]KAH9940378.1 hypothetical protein BXZ73DRAFT_88638 [Epithele typhae]